mmetsp:Transcript_12065/g.17397  ORF Transcript_12065/g.17397 Transcript_12065/m.17397 type:complete len:401 (+) Transcript_12065:635-1837(+)|eukprot:CAMPEP_0172422456 /NCGR_PEP_ID=MMETSP1064-20121228/8597_1 /TAXON_ID=202472 /ORGANISM="Aulacoseira subarctica , Strain CCAP 1002/5" /LENGTH=400 /DNA_ID=CAMNT_0013163315 /DNA_START=518 /DNA_END=1720 /DNA_ORIENTATION=-
MATESEARKEAIRSLRLWGIDSTIRQEHTRFQEKTLMVVAQCFSGRQQEMQRSKPKMLPDDPNLAVKMVLRAEVKDFNKPRYRLLEDNIKDPSLLFQYPYYSKLHTSFDPDLFASGKLNYVVKLAFKKINKRELDPLARFSEKLCTKKELFLDRWMNPDSGESVQGHIIEAIIVSHAIYNEACYNCKARKVLRWNGGPGAPWTDMECICCDSAYYIQGGCYAGFHNLHGQSRKNGWKHYLVLVSRMKSFALFPDKGPGFHQCRTVQIAEIKTVLPRLQPSCFIDGVYKDRRMTIKSEIKTKISPITWFKIPYQPVSYASILMQVMEEFFPGVAEELAVGALNFELDEADTDRAAEQAVEVDVEKNVPNTEEPQGDKSSMEDLRSLLQNMATADSWEDLSD